LCSSAKVGTDSSRLKPKPAKNSAGADTDTDVSWSMSRTSAPETATGENAPAWAPLVTQHAGQAAFIRGVLLRRRG
jgi:hypothetical protein